MNVCPSLNRWIVRQIEQSDVLNAMSSTPGMPLGGVQLCRSLSNTCEVIRPSSPSRSSLVMLAVRHLPVGVRRCSLSMRRALKNIAKEVISRIERRPAGGAKYRDVAYLDRRIKECKREIRARKKNIIHYEETLAAIENGKVEKRLGGTLITAETVTGWMEHEYELIEKAMDKQGFLEACVDQCGGIQFHKDNVKIGYHVKVKGDRYAEVIGAGPQNITYRILTGGAKGMVLTAAYAEITEVIQAAKQTETHPFTVGERFTAEQFVQDGAHRWKPVRVTYEIIKAGTKTIQLKPIDGDGKIITRKPKKSYNGRWCFALDDNYRNIFYKAESTTVEKVVKDGEESA